MITIYVTIFGKANHVCAFCISRNTNLKYLMHCASPVAQYSHAIANSTSYMNAACFSGSFFQLLHVISLIESIGGGRVGGGWAGGRWGQVESRRQGKVPKSSAVTSVSDMN